MGVPDGVYCFVTTANPDHSIVESDYGNNAASARLELSGETVTTFPDQPCPGEKAANPGPTPDPTSSILFADTLNWGNWSWDTKVNLEETSYVCDGRWSIAVTHQAPWAGLALNGGSFDTTGYSYPQFALHPGASGQLSVIDMALTDANDTEMQKIGRCRMQPRRAEAGTCSRFRSPRSMEATRPLGVCE